MKTHLGMSSINDNLITIRLLPIIYPLHLPEYVTEEYFPDPPSEIWGWGGSKHEVEHTCTVTVFS